MDFAWTSEQSALFADMVARVKTGLHAKASERGFDNMFGREEWLCCGRLGLLGLPIPSQYGGGGHSCLISARLMEAFGFACEDLGLVFGVGAHLFACAIAILEFGSEALKTRLLPGLCAGELIGANAISEEQAGSDAFALTMTADRQGDDYVLNGTKSWVTNSVLADVVIVYARTSKAVGQWGISAFVVEPDRPGVAWASPFQKIGLQSTPAAALTLTDCRVPASSLLGGEGMGGTIFSHAMTWERAALFAGFLGAMQRQLDLAVAHARQRSQFGREIGRNQAVSHRIVDMKVRLEVARLLLYRACWKLDTGQIATFDAAIAKLVVSEAMTQSSMDLMRIFASAGFAGARDIDRGLRDSIGGLFASGTSEMQRELIAVELGL